MKYLIISFKNRNNLYPFINLLKKFGIPSGIINTPRNISSSCGLSAKVEYRFYNNVLDILSKSNHDGLIGIFLLSRIGLHEQIERIV